MGEDNALIIVRDEIDSSGGVVGDVLVVGAAVRGGRVHYQRGVVVRRLCSRAVKTVVSPLVNKPWVMAEGLVVTVLVGEVMAFCGVIGEKGHGLYEWVHHEKHWFRKSMRRLGFQPGGWMRQQLEAMMEAFVTWPKMPKFATGVSIGGATFPFLLQSSVWIARCVLVGLVLGEVLAVMGVLGDPGRGLAEWYTEERKKEHRHHRHHRLRSIRRSLERGRWLLRNELQLSDMLRGFVDRLRTDAVFWSGFAVGSVARTVFEVMERDETVQAANPK